MIPEMISKCLGWGLSTIHLHTYTSAAIFFSLLFWTRELAQVLVLPLCDYGIPWGNCRVCFCPFPPPLLHRPTFYTVCPLLDTSPKSRHAEIPRICRMGSVVPKGTVLK